jgi:hypothetical protein
LLLRGKKLQEAEENCLVMTIQILYTSPITINVIDKKGASGDACCTYGKRKKKLEGKGPVG